MNKMEGVKLAKLEQKLDDHCLSNDKDLSEIKNGIIRIETKLDVKTNQSEFVFWRNLLVSGILIGILLGVIALLLGK